MAQKQQKPYRIPGTGTDSKQQTPEPQELEKPKGMDYIPGTGTAKKERKED